MTWSASQIRTAIGRSQSLYRCKNVIKARASSNALLQDGLYQHTHRNQNARPEKVIIGCAHIDTPRNIRFFEKRLRGAYRNGARSVGLELCPEANTRNFFTHLRDFAPFLRKPFFGPAVGMEVFCLETMGTYYQRGLWIDIFHAILGMDTFDATTMFDEINKLREGISRCLDPLNFTNPNSPASVKAKTWGNQLEQSGIHTVADCTLPNIVTAATQAMHGVDNAFIHKSKELGPDIIIVGTLHAYQMLKDPDFAAQYRDEWVVRSDADAFEEIRFSADHAHITNLQRDFTEFSPPHVFNYALFKLLNLTHQIRPELSIEEALSLLDRICSQHTNLFYLMLRCQANDLAGASYIFTAPHSFLYFDQSTEQAQETLNEIILNA